MMDTPQDARSATVPRLARTNSAAHLAAALRSPGTRHFRFRWTHRLYHSLPRSGRLSISRSAAPVASVASVEPVASGLRVQIRIGGHLLDLFQIIHPPLQDRADRSLVLIHELVYLGRRLRILPLGGQLFHLRQQRRVIRSPPGNRRGRQCAHRKGHHKFPRFLIHVSTFLLLHEGFGSFPPGGRLSGFAHGPLPAMAKATP